MSSTHVIISEEYSIRTFLDGIYVSEKEFRVADEDGDYFAGMW